MALDSSSIGQGSPVCLDVNGNGIDCGTALSTSTCFNGDGDEVECYSYSSSAVPASVNTSQAVSTLGATSAAGPGNTSTAIGPALGIFSSLTAAATTAYVATQTPVTQVKPTALGIPAAGTSSLVLLAGVVLVAFLLLKKK